MTDWVADRDDVLCRARHSRFRTRRALAVGAVAAVAVVLLMPGIGIGGGLSALISGPRRPGIALRAELTLPGGQSVGTLSVHASRILVLVPPKDFFVPRGHKPVLPPVPVRWSLDLAGGRSARSAVVRDSAGRLIGRLCAPCGSGAHGTIELHPRAVLDTVRAQAVVQTSAGTARGLLRLPRTLR